MRFRLKKAASPINPAVVENPGMMSRVPKKVYTRPIDAVNAVFQSGAGLGRRLTVDGPDMQG